MMNTESSSKRIVENWSSTLTQATHLTQMLSLETELRVTSGRFSTTQNMATMTTDCLVTLTLKLPQAVVCGLTSSRTSLLTKLVQLRIKSRLN